MLLWALLAEHFFKMIELERKMLSPYVCYVINQSCGARTYCGATNNLVRRLRQHNGEICGGARYTTRNGSGWTVYFVIGGFLTRRECLRFEYRMKHIRTPRGLTPRERRDHALRTLLRAWPYALRKGTNLEDLRTTQEPHRTCPPEEAI